MRLSGFSQAQVIKTSVNDDSVFDDIDEAEQQEFFSTESRNSVNITIKNYKLQYGLSSKFFADNDEVFGLTGPLGKGLGLLPTSKGVHIAFSAGTGILPFVDMVAKLLFQEMEMLPNDEELFHDDFKLVMFVGFQNRKDGIALPILDGLKELVDK